MRLEGVVGCSDHGCIFGHPGGMGTNGGCNCEKTLRYALKAAGYSNEEYRTWIKNIRLMQKEIERGKK